MIKCIKEQLNNILNNKNILDSDTKNSSIKSKLIIENIEENENSQINSI